MKHHLSRRTFLHGAGVTMALPWMESLPVWGDEPAKASKPESQAPVRLAVLFSELVKKWDWLVVDVKKPLDKQT